MNHQQTASLPAPADALARSFEEHGYVVVPSLVGASDLAVLLRRTREIVDSSRPDGVAPSQIQRFFGKSGAPRMIKIAQLTRTDDSFRALAHLPAIVDVVERLIGPGARLFRDVVVGKPARTGGKLSFHQDSAYWDVEPPRLLSAWVALTDVPVEASPLEVISGSHRALIEHGLMLRDRIQVPRTITRVLRGLVSRAGTGDNPGASGGSPALWRLKTMVLAGASRRLPLLADLQDYRALPSLLEGAEVVPLPVNAGDVVFFHSLLLHASSANRAAHDRFADIISYMPAGARLTSSDEGDFPPARLERTTA